MMLFETKFEVLELRDNGVKITHWLKGKRKDVKKDIDMFKKNSKDYKMASTIMILIVSATVITSIVNVAKPAYKKFT